MKPLPIFRSFTCGLVLSKKYVLCIILLLAIYYSACVYKCDVVFNKIQNGNNNCVSTHRDIVAKYFEQRKLWNTSYLGSILFKNIASEVFTNTQTLKKTYLVLIWKYMTWLKKRHVLAYKTSTLWRLLEDCSVKNCNFTGDSNAFNNADAVVVHTQHGNYPNVQKRNVNQRWIFLNDESPLNKFSLAKHNKPKISEFADIFNWTMTYRSDSDISVPYGRTIPRLKPLLLNENNIEALNRLVPYWKHKQFDKPMAILMSNCNFKPRMKVLGELRRHLLVDVHGACGEGALKKSCPGHFKADCPVLSKYIFYLVLENSRCQEYITEKVFYNAYSKGAIPVILGPPYEDCKRLLPPDSFIHIEHFKTMKDVADLIKDVTKNLDKLLLYHKWRNHFQIVNEHGYFGTKSKHFCRICEALNYNDRAVSVYNEEMLNQILNEKLTCK